MKKHICMILGALLLFQNVVFAKASDKESYGFNNPSFEQDLSGWYTSGSGFSITDSESTDGGKALKFQHGTLEYAKLAQPVRVDKYKSYNVCFDIKGSSGAYVCSIESASGKIVTTDIYISNNEWNKQRILFDSGACDEVVFSLKNVDLPSRAIYFDNFEIFENEENLVINGDFENGKDGWERGSFNIVTDDVYKGKASAVHWGESSYDYQKISVEKNSEYILKFAYKNKNLDASNCLRVVVAGNSGINRYGYPNDGISLVGDSVGGEITRAGKLCELSVEWMEVEERLYTGENNEIYLSIIHDNGNHNSSNAAPFFDGFMLIPVKGSNLVINGDFEDGKNGWERGSFNIASDNPYSGNFYGSHWGESSFFYQKIEVKKNSEYNLSFAYKNKNLDSSNCLRVVVAGNSGINQYGYPNDGISLIGDCVGGNIKRAGRLYSLNTEWTQINELVSTGENTEIYLSIIHDNTNQNPKNAPPLFDAFSIRYTGENMIRNGSFDNGRALWEHTGFNVISDGESGRKSVASMWGAEWYSYQRVNVKKNFNYDLSFFYRNTVTENTNKIRVIVCGERGINEKGYPYDGKSLIDEKEGIAREKPGKRYPVTTEWTKVTETFNSGENEEVYVVLMHDLTYGREGYKPPLLDDVRLNPSSCELIDSDFEYSGLKNWTAVGAQIERDSEKAYKGRRSALIYDSLNASMASLSKAVPVEKYKNYVLGYWYKNVEYGHDLSIYDSSYPLADDAKRIVPMRLFDDETEDWTYAEERFNSGNNSVVTIDFSANNSNNRSMFYLDDVKLTMPQPKIIGATVLGYPKNGKTIYSHIDEINLNGDVLADTLYQWQSSEDNVEWTDIRGATDDTYIPAENDLDKKLRLKITPVGDTNTGEPYYTKPIDASSSSNFENEIVRRINQQLLYLPGWLGSEYGSYTASLLKLCSITDEYGIELSSDKINLWNRFLDVVSNISTVKSIKSTVGVSPAVTVEMTAPIKLTELESFSVYDKNGEQIKVTKEPLETIQYQKTDGTVADFVKSLKITLKEANQNNEYRLKRITYYGESYYYNFSAMQTVEVKNAEAVINGGTVNVKAEIGNTETDIPIIAVIYAAVYDKDNKLINVKLEEAELVKGGEAKTVNINMTTGENPDINAVTAVIYVWDRQNNFPYAEKTVFNLMPAAEKP